MNLYKLSETHRCLLDAEVNRMRITEPAITRRCVSSWGESTRVYSIIGTSIGQVLADRNTGTLFNPRTGQCFTSERIHLLGEA